MKSRLAVALATVMLLGTGIAVAVGSLKDEAVISKSYFDDVYLPALADSLRQRAEKDTDSTYKQAEKSLEERSKAHLDKAGGELAAYTCVQMAAGDELELRAGGSLLLFDGQGQLTAGALADVTDGTTAEAGQSLLASHRYIATADAAMTQTASGSVGYQGEGTVHKGADDKPRPSAGITTPSKDPTLPLPFADVAEDSWYYSAVAFVYDRGYFSGTGADAFSPNSPMNRAMVATVLHRISGSGTVSGGATFTDVPAGQWYSDGIAWASANGVVNGMGDGLYAPEMSVTREQLVTMLYRYEKDYRKVTVSGRGELSAFPDGEAVSAWAQEAMSWAVGAGLLQGRNSGELDPSGTATRAEVATILQRFSQRL